LPLNFKTLRLLRSKNIFSKLWNPLKNSFLSNTIVLETCAFFWNFRENVNVLRNSLLKMSNAIFIDWKLTKYWNLLCHIWYEPPEFPPPWAPYPGPAGGNFQRSPDPSPTHAPLTTNPRSAPDNIRNILRYMIYERTCFVYSKL
jgi:hypothetical protein